MIEWVLDASAILAYLKQEPGGDLVGTRLDSAVVTSVNLAEIAAKLLYRSGDAVGSRTIAEGLSCDVVPVDRELGLTAGLMLFETQSRGLSLGDRICLAYAKRVGLPVLTADRPWAELDIGIDIRLIR